MPGGPYDSSKTRVAPVFDQLMARSTPWVRELLSLVKHGASGAAIPAAADLTLREGFWGDKERPLDPPVSLLSWLIRNLEPSGVSASASSGRRKDLLARNPEAIADALQKLRSEGTGKAWYILEGQTFPDALLYTPDALIVVEGKRTEPGPTTSTTWLEGRHQIWRHIDAAWEVRGARHVFGFFIVEGEGTNGTAVPAIWREAIRSSLSASVLASSFPHRGVEEVAGISKCLLGATTWQEVCRTFGINYGALPNKLP